MLILGSSGARVTYEIAGLVFVLAANCDVPLFLLNVGEEGLDLFILHRVLDWAH